MRRQPTQTENIESVQALATYIWQDARAPPRLFPCSKFHCGPRGTRRRHRRHGSSSPRPVRLRSLFTTRKHPGACRMRVAVVGSGISGLSCAYRLSQAGNAVTLYEAGAYFGGHTHTVDVQLEGITHGVDTGFLVFNHRTYPNLVKLFAELEVETVATDMSFSVKMPVASRFGARTLEWAGGNLDTVFTQRGNLLRP